MPSPHIHTNPDRFFHYPSLSMEDAAGALSLLVHDGGIPDDGLLSRADRLAGRFRAYVLSAPVPCWAPGIVVTDEMRRITEGYIPYYEIRQALKRLCRLALKGDHPIPPLLEGVDNWLELLNLLPGDVSRMDPSSLLCSLATDGDLRKRFLFSLYLPARYGGAFGRYPVQAAFLRDWLKALGDKSIPVSILDAACGSGEGVYELAACCREVGLSPQSRCIAGITISPLEIFSAAYACFPHDSIRETVFRRFVQPLHESGAVQGVRFRVADIRNWHSEELYQVIVCNGVLGGPMMHDRKVVELCVKRLAGALAEGGILLAADRFHGGWQKAFPRGELERIFRQCDLRCLGIGEGVAGVRT